MCLGLTAFPEWEAAFDHLWALLAPGGRMAIVDVHAARPDFQGKMVNLVARADGPGRALALEIMIPDPAIRNLIREDKVHQIYSQMQVGQGEHGMQTFNQSLAELVLTGEIDRELALTRSSQPAELASMLQSGKSLSTVQRTGRKY